MFACGYIEQIKFSWYICLNKEREIMENLSNTPDPINVQKELANSLLWHTKDARPNEFPLYIDAEVAIRSRLALREVGATVLQADCHAAVKMANDSMLAKNNTLNFLFNESSVHARGVNTEPENTASGVFIVNRLQQPRVGRSWRGI